MAAGRDPRSTPVPAGLVPPGTTELGIDIIRVERIRAALERFGARFSGRVLTAGRAALRPRPAGDVRRSLGGQGGGQQGPRAGRPRASAGGHRDRAAAHRPARRPPPRPGGRPGRPAGHGPDRDVDHPRVRLRGGDRLRGPDGRRAVRLPARHRGAARRARAAAPRPDGAAPGLAAEADGLAEAPAETRGRDPGTGPGPAADVPRPRRGGGTAACPDGALERSTTGSRPASCPERPTAATRARSASCWSSPARSTTPGAALLVCRAAGRAGAGLVTLAVPESLQPLFAAKVVEATTMALPEDDVEEVDPEHAARPDPRPRARRARRRARPPARARHGRARSAACWRSTSDGEPAAGRRRRRGAPLARRRDGWWEAIGRPSSSRRTPASSPGCGRRAASRPEPTATCADDDAREAAARDAAAALGPGRRPQGRPHGRSPPRRGGRVAPFENPALATRRDRRRAGRDDRRAARPGPRALRGGSPRRPPPRRSPATRSATGSATPACSPATCRSRSRSPASACAADAPSGGGGSGLGRSAPRPADAPDRPDAAAPRPARDAERARSRPGSPAAGLPPLPRTAWLEIDLDRLAGNLAALRGGPAGRRPARARRQGRRLRPRRGPGRGGRSRRPAPTASASPPSTRRSSCGRAGSAAPLLVLFAGPARRVAEAMRPGVAVAASGERPLGRTLAADAAWRAAAPRPAARPCGVQLDVETGPRARRADADGRARPPRRRRRDAGRPPGRRPGRTSSAADDRPRTAGQVDALRGRRSAALASAGVGCRHRHLAASARAARSGRRRRTTACGSGWRRTASSPTTSAPTAARRARRPRLRPILSLHARPVRVADLPAGTGISYGPTFITARPSRIATLPLGYGDGWSRARSRTGRTALVRGGGCRSSGTWRWTR